MRRAAVAALLALAACSSYRGSARDFAPARLAQEPGWLSVRAPGARRQRAENECGLVAAAMLLDYWQRPVTLPQLRAEAGPLPDRGIRAGRLRELVRARGLKAFLIHGRISDLERELARGRPVLVGLVKLYGRTGLAHYELVVAIHRRRQIIVTLDPAAGWRENSFRGFLAEWKPSRNLTLVALPPPPEITPEPAGRPGPPGPESP